MHFLDSSVCVLMLRGRTAVSASPAHADTAISSVVAAELWAGVEKSNRLGEAGRLEELFELFAVVDFDHAAARHYGEIHADLEKRGTPIGPLDLLIAAHARSLGATIVTANASEFKRIKGLKVLVWK
ncbi:MAG: type II toxin-antitoxin system VapC family toxin [Verrucomicrobiales bacterium]